MEEVWKPVKDYEEYYLVSNLGNIFSLRKNKILKQVKIGQAEYLGVSLWKDGKEKRVGIHRLVASAFLPNPENLPEVNHKDENNKNNCVDNLEWCSHYYNMTYGTAAIRQAMKRGYDVVGVNENGDIIYGPYWACNEAGRKTGINRCCIATSVRTGKPHKGIYWKRIESREWGENDSL